MMCFDCALSYLSDLLNDLVQGQSSSPEEVTGQIQALCIAISVLTRILADDEKGEEHEEE